MRVEGHILRDSGEAELALSPQSSVLSPETFAYAGFQPSLGLPAVIGYSIYEKVYVSELASANVACCSRPTAGPIVEQMLSVRMYWPLAPVGLARTTASTSAPRFCMICSSLK